MTIATLLRAQAARLLELKQMLRCQHCYRPVGGSNPVTHQVGPLITGCKICTPERRRG